MRFFEVLTPLRGTPEGDIPAGAHIRAELIEGDAGALLACQAVREINPPRKNEQPAPPTGEKPLAKMNKSELDAVIAAETVTVPEGETATNKQKIAAIEAARAAKGGGL